MTVTQMRRAAAILAAAAAVATACSSSPATDIPAYQTASDLAPQTYATTDQVLAAVAAAQQTQRLSDSAAAHLAAMSREGEGPDSCFDKQQVDGAPKDALFGECTYGSRTGTKTMVLYADSRGPMWAAALERVAATTGWRLRVFSKGGCPVADLQFQNNETKAPDTDCDAFHTAAIEAIRKLKPQLIITASHAGHKLTNGEWPTTSQWQDAWVSTLQKLSQPGTRLAVLGAIPT